MEGLNAWGVEENNICKSCYITPMVFEDWGLVAGDCLGLGDELDASEGSEKGWGGAECPGLQENTMVCKKSLVTSHPRPH